jgi:hypothetical protein
MTNTCSALSHRTIAALFATSEDAEVVVTALIEGGFDRSSIDVTANTETGVVGRPVQEHGCESARGFDADRHDKPMIYLLMKGSTSGA